MVDEWRDACEAASAKSFAGALLCALSGAGQASSCSQLTCVNNRHAGYSAAQDLVCNRLLARSASRTGTLSCSSFSRESLLMLSAAGNTPEAPPPQQAASAEVPPFGEATSCWTWVSDDGQQQVMPPPDWSPLCYSGFAEQRCLAAASQNCGAHKELP